MNRCGFGAKLALGSLSVAVAAALLLSACSSDIGYPSVHDLPAPRADNTLTPDQVKQATDDLVSQGQHLDTEATGQVMPVNLTPGNASAQKPLPPQPAAARTGAPDDAMTTGASAKP